MKFVDEFRDAELGRAVSGEKRDEVQPTLLWLAERVQ